MVCLTWARLAGGKNQFSFPVSELSWSEIKINPATWHLYGLVCNENKREGGSFVVIKLNSESNKQAEILNTHSCCNLTERVSIPNFGCAKPQTWPPWQNSKLLKSQPTHMLEWALKLFWQTNTRNTKGRIFPSRMETDHKACMPTGWMTFLGSIVAFRNKVSWFISLFSLREM